MQAIGTLRYNEEVWAQLRELSLMRRTILIVLLCLCALYAGANPSLATSKRIALVIGIDRYDNLRPDAQLRKARSDAAAVAKTLREMSFDVMSAEDVTRSAFNSLWQDFLNRLLPGVFPVRAYRTL